jgi:hypothetical protein
MERDKIHRTTSFPVSSRADKGLRAVLRDRDVTRPRGLLVRDEDEEVDEEGDATLRDWSLGGRRGAVIIVG